MAVKVMFLNGTAHCKDESYVYLGTKTASELREWVEEVIAAAPQEHRESVRFAFEINDRDDRRQDIYGVFVQARWTRPPTEEEKAVAAEQEADKTAKRIAYLKEAAKAGKNAEAELAKLTATTSPCRPNEGD